MKSLSESTREVAEMLENKCMMAALVIVVGNLSLCMGLSFLGGHDGVSLSEEKIRNIMKGFVPLPLFLHIVERFVYGRIPTFFWVVRGLGWVSIIMLGCILFNVLNPNIRLEGLLNNVLGFGVIAVCVNIVRILLLGNLARRLHLVV